jgi:hypothetical protein
VPYAKLKRALGRLRQQAFASGTRSALCVSLLLAATLLALALWDIRSTPRLGHRLVHPIGRMEIVPLASVPRRGIQANTTIAGRTSQIRGSTTLI